MTDQARLVAAGWRHTQSNRWHHAAFPGTLGRVRLFSLADALGLLEASDVVGCAEEGAAQLRE
jgi:hypothetical protein